MSGPISILQGPSPDYTGLDGLSLYRALSRLTLGDPVHFVPLMNSVLEHFLRSLVDERASTDSNGRLVFDDIHHERYSYFDAYFPQSTKTFFGALCCPDLVICPCEPHRAASVAVLEVITNALNIRLVVHTDDMQLLFDGGPVQLPLYQVKLEQGQTDDCHHRVVSLESASSGRSLIEYLCSQGDYLASLPAPNALKIKQIMWYFDHSDDQVKDYNGYSSNSVAPPNLSFNAQSLTVFTMSVGRPEQIRNALIILDEALLRAPGQEVQMHQHRSGTYRSLKRYVAIDSEFKPISLTSDQRRRVLANRNEQDQAKILRGDEEEICTVLTVAVDRHFVVSFYILDMLEHADATTATEVSHLFRTLIFNQRYLKLWFNFQSDFKVLDATIAHMYQGTPRPEYMKKDWRGNDIGSTIPTWKIHSDANHLGGLRPPDLIFHHGRHPRECEFHSPEVNDQGMACPCHLTSNIDITTIIEYISRQLNYRDLKTGEVLEKGAWSTPRRGVSYDKFLAWTMSLDRVYPFLELFKDEPARIQRSTGQAAKVAFYHSLGPGMERESPKMAYNIGDVVGIALLMRCITTTDDRMKLISILTNYNHGVLSNSSQPVWIQPPERGPELQPVDPYAENTYVLLDDYPKSWKWQEVGAWKLPSDPSGESVVANSFPLNPLEPVITRPLSTFQHSRQAAFARNSYLIEMKANPNSDYEVARRRALNSAHTDLFDPLDFSLPTYFTENIRDQTPGSSAGVSDISGTFRKRAVVRAGTSRLEDLYTAILEAAKRRGGVVVPPLGYGEIPGTYFGLPLAVNRVPGNTLELIHYDDSRTNVFAAFQGVTSRDIAPPFAPPSTEPVEPVRPYLPPLPSRNLSRIEQAHRNDIQREIVEFNRERERDAVDGPAAQTRLHDILDPHGRVHRKELAQWGEDNGLQWRTVPALPGSEVLPEYRHPSHFWRVSQNQEAEA